MTLQDAAATGGKEGVTSRAPILSFHNIRTAQNRTLTPQSGDPRAHFTDEDTDTRMVRWPAPDHTARYRIQTQVNPRLGPHQLREGRLPPLSPSRLHSERVLDA